MRIKNIALSSLLAALTLVGCGQLPQTGLPVGGASQAMDAFGAAKAPIADQFAKFAIEPTEWGMLSKQLPVPGKVLPFTYLTYEALDNNLAGDLKPILNKLEAIGSGDQLNLLAQTDGEGRKDTNRYYLMKLKETKEGVSSPYVPMTEGNSASASTLTGAMRWGFGSYPGKATWMNLSSHGAGWFGALEDHTAKGWLPLPKLASALKAGTQGKPLDVLSFDACLMASIEVAYEMKDVAKFMVGSEDSTFYWGRGYYNTMTKVAKNPAMAPKAIAADLVETAHDRAGGKVWQSLTVSAFDLGEADTAAKALDKLAVVLLKKVGPHREQMKQGLRDLKPFVITGPAADGFDHRDLKMALAAFGEIPDKELKTAVGVARDAIFAKGKFLVATRNSHHEKQATQGISVYLPVKGFDHRYRDTAMAKATQWDEFLIELCR